MDDAPSRPLSIEIGDRVEPFGEWPEDEAWVFGTVIDANKHEVTIRTESDKRFRCSRNRLDYKLTRAAWGVWPAWVAAEIDRIEEHERVADKARSRHNSRLLAGEYVKVCIADELVGCFVTRVLPDSFVCSIAPTGRLVPAFKTWTVSADMLAWDEAENCWVASYKPQGTA